MPRITSMAFFVFEALWLCLHSDKSARAFTQSQVLKPAQHQIKKKFLPISLYTYGNGRISYS